ncbi:MAG TPA: hypothetical protein VHK47_01800 [Polyangia bacterium]|jgi:hypothetical protein|nr:hypothetical protein [Polyangia bacterium]
MSPGRERSPRCLRAILAAALASSAGCSFAKMQPAPPPATWPDPVTPSSSETRCTASFGPPIVDSVAGVTLGTIGYFERNSGSPQIALIFGLGAIPYLASAVYGYINADRCHRYQSLFHE